MHGMQVKYKEKTKEKLSIAMFKPKRVSTAAYPHQNIQWKHQIILNNLKNKYCKDVSSERNEISKAILKQHECSLTIKLVDWRFNREEQKFTKYYKKEQSSHELKSLFEYYRYYTQTSTIFLSDFFISMYNYRQLKKSVDIKRIKLLLNLSESQEQELTAKKSDQYLKGESTFYILPFLRSHLKIDIFQKEETNSLAWLIKEMPVDLKLKRKSTIEQIDDDYSFLKKTAINFSPKTEKSFDEYEQVQFSRQNKRKPLYQNKTIQNSRLKEKEQIEKHSSCQTKNKESKIRFHRKNLQSMNDMETIVHKKTKQNQTPVFTKKKEKEKIQLQIKLKVIDLKNKIKVEKQKIRVSQASPQKSHPKIVLKNSKAQHFTIRKLYASKGFINFQKIPHK